LSDNDKKDKSDLTRIEDLSEFLHDEDEDLSELETYSEDDESEEELMDKATDPDLEFPPEFQVDSNDEEIDTSFESDDDSNSFGDDSEDSFGDDSEASFGDDNEDSFGDDSEDSFGDDSEDSFGDDSEDSFGDDNETSFGDDSEDSFGDDNEDSFGDDNEASFGDDSEDSFGDDNEDSFGDDSEDSFGDDNEDSFGDDNEDSFGDDNEDSFGDDNEASFGDDNEDSFKNEEVISSNEVETEVTSSLDMQESDGPDTQSPEPIIEKTQERPEQSVEKSSPPQDKTPITPLKDKEKYSGPENFNELQKFAKNISYGNMGHEGNPPFSIVLKDIKFKEDIDDIINILTEYNILTDENTETAKQSLERGNMLIPRLGEYSAIHLCHKLRKFDISILMGLTEEIHPPKSYESDDSGIVSKYTVYNTKSHHYTYDKDNIQVDDIITSTTPLLEGYHIRDYINIVSEFVVIDAKTLAQANNLESDLKSALPEYQQEKITQTEVRSENLKAAQSATIKDFFPANSDEDTNNNNQANLNDVYSSLLEKIKLKALKSKGNAIVGINYNVTPIVKEESYFTETNYQVTCSGSIVWANKV
jgi:uncharacterized protein YbjQ (UPF0145 family)